MRIRNYITAIMLLAATQTAHADVSFSMQAEAEAQNTPEGWTAVELPQGLPAFTAANTLISLILVLPLPRRTTPLPSRPHSTLLTRLAAAW